MESFSLQLGYSIFATSGDVSVLDKGLNLSSVCSLLIATITAALSSHHHTNPMLGMPVGLTNVNSGQPLIYSYSSVFLFF